MGTWTHVSKLLAQPPEEIVCTAAGAAWTDAANLVTITRRVTSGVFRDELSSVKNPDGTLALYQYTTNASPAWKMTTVWSGQPGDSANTNVIAGTRMVTTVGLAGQMMTNQVFDIAASTLTDQQSYSDYDDQQRPRKVSYLDGTFTLTGYGCCGIDVVTNRDGIATSYFYDTLKRKTSEVTLGITTSYVYDGAGRVIQTSRMGTDGTNIVQGKMHYDLAGRLDLETNAVGVVTAYGESYDAASGQTTRATTNAVGTAVQTTRFELYAADGSLLKITGTSVNPVRYDYGVESEGGVQRLYKKEIKLDASYADTSEWTKTYTDFAGRGYKAVYAAASGTPNVQSYFNTLGQQTKMVDPDGVTSLVAYNLEGAPQDSVLDTNRNSTIDYAGLDRVSRTLNDVVYNATLAANVRRARTIIFPNDNDGVTTQEVARVENSVDGLKTMRTSFGQISTSVRTVPSVGSWTVTETAADGSKVITAFANGRPSTVTRQNASGGQLGQTTY